MFNKKKRDKTAYIEIEIDEELYTIPKGYTLATAITYAKQIGYRKTRYGDTRGPFCNMGVCFECSAYLYGKGNVRACMIKAENGMKVRTTPDFDKIDNSLLNDTPQNVSRDNTHFDVTIIGGGPAGLAALEELNQSDAKIAVIDEQQNFGGQIYRHIPEEIKKQKPHKLVNNIKQMKNNRIEYIQGSSVWSITPFENEDKIKATTNIQGKYSLFLDNQREITTDYLIVATGAYDYVPPFKGWEKPGVMSAGGLQLFSKTQNFVPGKNIILAGSHPFILIAAKNILDSGGHIEGIAFSQHIPNIKFLVEYGINGLKQWKKSQELIQAIRKIKMKRIPIWLSTVPTKAQGDKQIDVLHLSKVSKDGHIIKNSEFIKPCDALGVCYGFVSSSEIPRQMNCEAYYDKAQGGHLIKVDNNMQSSQNKVYVAGELTGVGGADLSEVEGRIAGLSILERIEANKNSKIKKQLDYYKKERKSWLSFANMLSKATEPNLNTLEILEQEPETKVCRCEEVTYQKIKKVLEENPHLTSKNAIKLITRCGMGLCQGRYCEGTLDEIAKKELYSFKEDNFSTRFPVKPTLIGDFKK